MLSRVVLWLTLVAGATVISTIIYAYLYFSHCNLADRSLNASWCPSLETFFLPLWLGSVVACYLASGWMKKNW